MKLPFWIDVAFWILIVSFACSVGYGIFHNVLHVF